MGIQHVAQRASDRGEVLVVRGRAAEVAEDDRRGPPRVGRGRARATPELELGRRHTVAVQVGPQAEAVGRLHQRLRRGDERVAALDRRAVAPHARAPRLVLGARQALERGQATRIVDEDQIVDRGDPGHPEVRREVEARSYPSRLGDAVEEQQVVRRDVVEQAGIGEVADGRRRAQQRELLRAVQDLVAMAETVDSTDEEYAHLGSGLPGVVSRAPRGGEGAQLVARPGAMGFASPACARPRAGSPGRGCLLNEAIARLSVTSSEGPQSGFSSAVSVYMS